MIRTNERNADVLLKMIADGKTVMLSTCTRVTKITPKTAARFEAAGVPVLKNSKIDGHLLVASGRSYVDAQYTNVFVG